ncbi:hypothetical protein CLV89_1377 [Tritonibacter scottomollicae]|uniref:Uncharacterized protein n=2 Tax=Tritonibacter scottomollicae TaxID=483013 RepID=A0A2T1A0J1_TRISK|nr:hypothetical protein CLV89_1377 [Tritonibacter scottomollicae]
MSMLRYMTQTSWLKWLIPWGFAWLVVFAWPEWQERRELAMLRAEACEVMEERDFLQADAVAACTKDNDTYLAGTDAAVESQTTRLVGKVAEELDRLARAGVREDLEMFERITFAQFLDDYVSPLDLPISAETSDRLPERFAMDVPWMMITGYGQLRVENPDGDRNGTAHIAAPLSLDPMLRDIREGAVATICRRSDNPDLQCSGTVYVRRASSDISGYRVVRLEMVPINEAQIDAASQSLIRPRFTGSRSSAQGFYMRRFIDAFGPDGSICGSSTC